MKARVIVRKRIFVQIQVEPRKEQLQEDLVQSHVFEGLQIKTDTKLGGGKIEQNCPCILSAQSY